MAYAEEDMLEKIENRVNSIMLNRTLGPSTQTCLIKTLCSELVREERSRVLNHPAVVGLVEAAKDLVNDIRCAKICTLQVGGECNCGANGNLREFGKALAVFESLVKESQ